MTSGEQGDSSGRDHLAMHQLQEVGFPTAVLEEQGAKGRGGGGGGQRGVELEQRYGEPL